MVNFFKLTAALFSGSIKGHFGQWGEDVFLRKIFPKNKNNGTYLDIGAYDPFMHSNTAYLWMKGWTGFNVDANPHTIQRFNKIRPNDKNIWTAIIPNSDYEKGQLKNPVNDAKLIAKTLDSLGFDVIEKYNLATQLEFKNAIKEFGTRREN